ncbi:MAG TPA: threonine aldolase, partial [Cytophagales bacterium]|nr:threonine aldolase [Cytophagales bacterium]
DTNIIIFELIPSVTPQQFLAALESHQVKALAFGPTQIRIVTHIDFTDAMLTRAQERITKLSF